MSARVRVLRDVARGAACLQSSAEHMAPRLWADPTRAVRGVKTGECSFQTALEPDPWWEVELSPPVRVSAVVVYNYDTVAYNPSLFVGELREGVRFLRVLTRSVAGAWSVAYDHQQHAGDVFGGIQTGPLVVWLPALECSSLRLQLTAKRRLNLDAVEVFAECDVAIEVALKELFDAANCHNYQIAANNIERLGLGSEALATYATSGAYTLTEIGLSYIVTYLAEHDAPELADSVAEHYSAMGVRSATFEAETLRHEIAAGQSAQAAERLQRLAHTHPDYNELNALSALVAGMSQREPDSQIKLIVWDLDDTLWRGTLAEGDEVQIDETRAGFVRTARDHGIVCSIVSKNDREQALAKLRDFGIEDCFISPSIGFIPKGPAIAALLRKLRLRPQNCLFVDDNRLNLEEAKALNPGLQLIDAAAQDADARLSALLGTAKPDSGQRFQTYKLLDARDVAADEFAGDNVAFLRSCELRVAIVQDARNIRFAERIEELVNRSNQLNFTKSRIPSGTASYLVGAVLEFDCRTVFVRDRFGSHGLVGFAAFNRNTRQLDHFVFSCRIMHMQIEHVVMQHLRSTLPGVPLLVEPLELDYIEVVDHLDSQFHDDFRNAAQKPPADIRVMANCQSGVLIHYSGLQARCDPDSWPDVFTLMQGDPLNERRPAPYRYRILAMFAQYSQQACGQFSLDMFEAALQRACEAWQAEGAQCFLIIPPDSDTIAFEDHTGRLLTHAELNSRTRNVLARSIRGNFVSIELSAYVRDPSEVSSDARHFGRSVMMRVAMDIARQIAVLESSGASS